MINPSNLKLSIVICTHRRFDLLKLAIDSLINQTARKESYEVIVVDNDKSPNVIVRNLIEQYKDKFNINYIFEMQLGLSKARNSGGQATNSNWVGFIDDDAKAPENYVQSAINLINNIDATAFGGPYLPYFIDDKPKWFKDEYETGKSAKNKGFLKENQYLNGTNMIFNKNLLNSLNWFQINFGMSGKKIGYGEETDLQIRAREKNPDLKIYYDTDLFVYHLVQPNKLKLSDHLKRKYNLGKSQAYLWIGNEIVKNEQNKAPIKLIKIVFYFFTKGVTSIIFRNRREYPYWQNYVYEFSSKYFSSIGQEWQLTKDLLKNVWNMRSDFKQ